MENSVPRPGDNDTPLALRSVERAVAEQRAAYASEVRKLIEAGIAVMRRTGDVEPKVSDIVEESGLSNQAFYRHFASKDELLLTILDEGRRHLVEYLRGRMSNTDDPVDRVREWIAGVMAQAKNPEAAARTRPFALNGERLSRRFPEESARSLAALQAPLVEEITRLGTSMAGAERDADAIYHLTMGRMHRYLVEQVTPDDADVDHLVAFSLHGIVGRPRPGGVAVEE